MALPLIPIGIAAGLAALYLATRPSAAEQKVAADAKAKAAGAPVFPPELKGQFDALLNSPPDQDPAALETVASRLEALGFQGQATALRLKASQLRAAQGNAPPTTPAPAAPKPAVVVPAAPIAAPSVFVPGVFDAPAAPAPSAPAAPTRTRVPLPKRTLRQGMTGADVKQWQQFLQFKGISVGPSGADGDFGPNTLAATKVFQTLSALTPDGVAGPNTFKAALAAGY